MLEARRVVLDRMVEGVRLENDKVSVTVLPDKGADIYEWTHKPSGIDVLWKSPWGLRKPGAGVPSSFDSSVTWLEWYAGGWQVLFPNAGAACRYKGVDLNFHGEASTTFWDVTELDSDEDAAHVRLTARLFRSPFTIERSMRLPAGSTAIHIRETIRNDAREPMDYLWGHHPAYGAPLLSAESRIDTNARTILADDIYDPPASVWERGRTYTWPIVEREGTRTDLSHVPGPNEPRGSMGYLGDFDAVAWYGITNTAAGVGAGLAWQRDDFPFAWFWQEMHASPGFPWYEGVYVMAIEPSITNVGHGLVAAMESNQTHRALQPGESRTVEFVAVLYDSTTGIAGIDLDGSTTVR